MPGANGGIIHEIGWWNSIERINNNAITDDASIEIHYSHEVHSSIRNGDCFVLRSVAPQVLRKNSCIEQETVTFTQGSIIADKYGRVGKVINGIRSDRKSV